MLALKNRGKKNLYAHAVSSSFGPERERESINFCVRIAQRSIPSQDNDACGAKDAPLGHQGLFEVHTAQEVGWMGESLAKIKTRL